MLHSVFMFFRVFFVAKTSKSMLHIHLSSKPSDSLLGSCCCCWSLSQPLLGKGGGTPRTGRLSTAGTHQRNQFSYEVYFWNVGGSLRKPAHARGECGNSTQNPSGIRIRTLFCIENMVGGPQATSSLLHSDTSICSQIDPCWSLFCHSAETITQNMTVLK